MDKICDLEESIRESFNRLDTLLSRSPTPQIAKNISTILEYIRLDLEYYGFDAELMEGNDKNTLLKLIADYNIKLKSYQEKAKGRGAIQQLEVDDTLENIGNKIEVFKEEDKQIVFLGDEILDESLRLLLTACKLTTGQVSAMKQVNSNLHSENEKLDNIHSELYTTKGVLKQSSKLIGSIIKDYYKDKFIVGMSIVVLLLCLAVITITIIK